MDRLMSSVLPTIMLLVGFISLFSIVAFWKHKVKKRKNPLTIVLLRAPGESLLNEIDELSNDLLGMLIMTFITPLLFVSLHLSESYIGAMPETINRFVINLLAMIVLTIYCGNKSLNILKDRENRRLGYDAERATGQELNNLLSIGYKVYHDVPGNKFNIDHVVVGNNGVFAVETKGRSKKIMDEGKDNSRVIYDGDFLNFPSWKETKPINQVKNTSIWLSTELSSAVGENINVFPVLSISGWYIDRKTNATPCVYNGKTPEKIFPKLRGQELSEQMITRVTHQIERMVNDVKPKAYKSKKNK